MIQSPANAMSDTIASIPEHEAEAIVHGLYRGFLGRAPDPAGLAYWSGRLAQGASSHEVLAAIMGSDEYRAAQGGATSLPALRERVAAAT
jgi:hypothetical protein